MNNQNRIYKINKLLDSGVFTLCDCDTCKQHPPIMNYIKPLIIEGLPNFFFRIYEISDNNQKKMCLLIFENKNSNNTHLGGKAISFDNFLESIDEKSKDIIFFNLDLFR